MIKFLLGMLLGICIASAIASNVLVPKIKKCNTPTVCEISCKTKINHPLAGTFEHEVKRTD